jgi:hypothetical protein
MGRLISKAAILLTLIFLSSTQVLSGGDMKTNIDNPFGVLEFLHWSHSWNNYKYPDDLALKKVIRLMHKAGVGWVRLDFLWEDIEPQQGKFEFAKYDNLVKLLKEQGIQILGILHYSAAWASACGEWNCPPKDNQVFVNYAEEVIRRYKSEVKYWEVWNEPDSVTYWKQQDSLKSYCALLKAVYLAAKKIDPDCKILNGGLANGLASVNHLYDNGAKGYFDILNIHFFQNPLHGKSMIKGVASYPKLAYKIMARNGDGDKKIWITEIGCPGVKPGLKAGNWWLGKNPTEAQQAVWVKEVYEELLKNPRVEKVFWAFFRDTKKHWDNGVDYFGLVRWDYTVKPAFKAYQKCFKEWKKKSKIK